MFEAVTRFNNYIPRSDLINTWRERERERERLGQSLAQKKTNLFISFVSYIKIYCLEDLFFVYLWRQIFDWFYLSSFNRFLFSFLFYFILNFSSNTKGLFGFASARCWNFVWQWALCPFFSKFYYRLSPLTQRSDQ